MNGEVFRDSKYFASQMTRTLAVPTVSPAMGEVFRDSNYFAMQMTPILLPKWVACGWGKYLVTINTSPFKWGTFGDPDGAHAKGEVFRDHKYFALQMTPACGPNELHVNGEVFGCRKYFATQMVPIWMSKCVACEGRSI